jgi:hypothetical protein
MLVSSTPENLAVAGARSCLLTNFSHIASALDLSPSGGVLLNTPKAASIIIAAITSTPHPIAGEFFSEILMDDHVAKTASQRPNVFGVSGTEFGGESAACFADDHEVVDNPSLNQLIAVKCVTP